MTSEDLPLAGLKALFSSGLTLLFQSCIPVLLAFVLLICADSFMSTFTQAKVI